jgi:agmatinase
MISSLVGLLALSAIASAHGDHNSQSQLAGPHQGIWYNTLPGDGGTQVRSLCILFWHVLVVISNSKPKADSVFSGISTFGRLPYYPCLASDAEKYDIAFLGKLALESSAWLIDGEIMYL